MKIRTGDTVLIISGKDKGKQGTILKVLKNSNQIIIEGINMRTRHIKKTTQAAGQRIQYEASMDASKVMIVDPKTKKPTRVGFKIDEKGKKSRIAKMSGEVIAKAAVAKATKGKKKEDAAPAKVEKKKEEVAAKPETKQPFWKRGPSKAAGEGGVKEEKTGGAAALPMAHRSQGG